MRPLYLLVAAGAAALLLASCGYPDPAVASGPAATTQETTPTPTGGVDDFNEGANRPVIKLPDGLQEINLSNGDGPTVVSGATVQVQYTGWLSSGKKFDSSRDSGQPLQFTVGQHQIIDGMDEGLLGMKVGGRRKLIIPPSLGYKDQAQGPIPANSTLVFTVEITAITAQPTPAASPAGSPSPSPTR